MKCEVSGSDMKVELSTLEYGSTFYHNGFPWILTDSRRDEVLWAVDLVDGELCSFQEDSRVLSVPLKVVRDEA